MRNRLARLFRKALKPRSNRGRILFWACLAGLVWSFFFATPIDNFLRDQRSALRSHKVNTDIVLIAVDNRSVAKMGRFPWPRRYHGLLAKELNRMGARRILFNIVFADKSNPIDDRLLAEALKPLGKKVVLPMTYVQDDVTGEQMDLLPLPEIAERASTAHINLRLDNSGAVRSIPFDHAFGNRVVPSLAARLANTYRRGGEFPIDFSIDPMSTPIVSAVDVIERRVAPDLIAGKDVVIASTYAPYYDGLVAPRYGLMPGVYIQLLGAETLTAGPPVTLPWWVGLIPAILLIVTAGIVNNRVFSLASFSSAVVGLLLLPLLLESHSILIGVALPLSLLVFVGGALSWTSLRQMYRARGRTNAISGLPNLAALQEQVIKGELPLVAARVHNYAAIASTLPPEGEKVLAEQISRRLVIGAAHSALYQGDEGIFAWYAEPGTASSTASYLDALHQLFRSAIMIDSKPYDLVITFGFDIAPTRTVANRLASALVAAEEAHREGLRWKEHDPAAHEDSAWKLSLLSQLDAAIDVGDLWVAYQPKLDLATDRIVGAEALARWTHPQKGPISPIEFVLAAEQSNRIEKLTHYVLENAIRVAAVINRQGTPFNMSVNLSARLIDEPSLPELVRSMLEKHGLPAENLTLEVTETAALGSNASNIETMQRLRDLGVYLSVDDYGTGMSTLDYLHRVPATEIKIDRSFVAAMCANHTTRVMVNSTIQLAHSLGQKVVAEGVEDQETLDELKRMGCDLAQGYLIGRPVTFRALSKQILGTRADRAA